MKRAILILLALIIFGIWGCSTSSQTYVEQQDPYPTFNSLDSYGQWINVPGIGTVWRPYDENNWQPYADGHWVWTDQGWMWDSNEPYGWVVYHYGNWQFSNQYGWVWIPGYDWQPARVEWYQSDGYIGWAPLPPPGAYQQPDYYRGPVEKVWIIVPEGHFVDRDIVKYRTRSVAPDIQVLRSRDGGRAPDVRNIERVTRRTIDPVRPVREQVNAGGRSIIRVKVENDRGGNTQIRNDNNPPAVLPVGPPERGVEPPANTKPSREPVNKTNPPRQIDRGNTIQRGPIRDSSGRKDVREAPPNNVRKEPIKRTVPIKRTEPVKKQVTNKRESVKKKEPVKNQNEIKREEKAKKDTNTNNRERN